MSNIPESSYRVLTEADFGLPETARKLQEFLRLDVGWHFGEGGPISQDMYEAAMGLYEFVIQNGFTQTDAFPGLNGEVRLTLYKGAHYLEFTIGLDFSVTFLYEIEGEEKSFEEHLSLKESRQRVLQAAEELWTTSDLSTQNIMISILGASKVGPFLTGTAEFLSSKKSASVRAIEASASTSSSIMGRKYLEILQSSGNSTNTYCRTNVA